MALPPARHRARVGVLSRRAERRRRGISDRSRLGRRARRGWRPCHRRRRRGAAGGLRVRRLCRRRRGVRCAEAAVRGVAHAEPASRPQSRAPDLLRRADLPEGFRRGARFPRLAAILVLAALGRHGLRSCLDRRAFRPLAADGRAPVEPGRAARLDAPLSADSPRLGDIGAAQARGGRGHGAFARGSHRLRHARFQTLRSFPISRPEAIPSPLSRPAPGRS